MGTDRKEKCAYWTSMYADDASAMSLNKIVLYSEMDDEPVKGKAQKDGVAFFFCINGKVRFEQDGKTTMVKGGEVLCSYVSKEYTIRAFGNKTKLIVLITSGKLAREMMEHRLKDMGSVIRFNSDVIVFCDRIYNIAKETWSYEGEIQISCLLYRICGELMIQHSKSSSLEDVVVYMQEHYSEDIPITKLCEICHLGSTQLIDKFKKTYGMTPKVYLTAVRMEKARSALLTTDASVSCIASMVGYEDASYFTRVFKKEEGMTPREYKNRY